MGLVQGKGKGFLETEQGNADLTGQGGMPATGFRDEPGSRQLIDQANHSCPMFQAQVLGEPFDAWPVAMLGGVLAAAIESCQVHGTEDGVKGVATIPLHQPRVNGLSDGCSGHRCVLENRKRATF